MDRNTVLVPLLLGGAGAVAGHAGRRLLARLRRGVVLPPGRCEAAVAAAWLLTGWCGPPGWWLAVPLLLGWFAVLLTATDLVHRRLPDALTLPGYPVLGVALLAATVWGDGAVAGQALLGLLGFGGLHLAVHLCRPAALGAGDVKLSGWLGAVLGALGWPAMALATVLAAVVTLVLAAAVRAWRTAAPHGPGLLAATWLLAVLVPP